MEFPEQGHYKRLTIHKKCALLGVHSINQARNPKKTPDLSVGESF